MDSEELQHRDELLQEIFERLYATSEADQAKVRAWIGRIATNLAGNIHEAEKAADAPKLAESRDRLFIEIDQIRELIESLDTDEPFLPYGGTATDNPFAGPAIHEQEKREHAAMIHERRALKANLKQHLAKLLKRAENPSWKTGGGPLTLHTMKDGTPESGFVADCLNFFESFRPGEMSATPEGDLYVVAANIYELITGRSLREKSADFSLEYYLRKAVAQYKRSARQK